MHTEIKTFIESRKWATLGTIDAVTPAFPFSSLVNYLFDSEKGEIYLSLSKIALHHRNISAHKEASLFVVDFGAEITLNSPRLNLSVEIESVGSERRGEIEKAWKEKFPDYIPKEIEGNFDYFVGKVVGGYFIGGFGKIVPF